MNEGAASRGKAGVFGSSINPLQLFLQQGANRERQKQLQAERQRKDRDLFISDIEKHSPAKVRDPFFEEIQGRAQQIRDKSYALLDQGYNKEAITRMVGKDWGDLDTEVSRANMKMDTFDQFRAELKENKKFYLPETESRLNDIWFEGNRARPINDINTDNARPQVFENPDLFNVNNIAVEFMKSLPEKVNQYYTDMWNPLGQQYNVQETKTKLGFQYARNPQTGQDEIVIDERTGQPKISMTPDVYIQAVQNPYLSKLVERDLPKGTVEQKKQYLTAILEGQDPKDIKNRPQLGFKYRDESELGVDTGSSIVGSGDNSLKSYDKIGSDKKIGFDSISFGYSSPTSIPFSTTQGGAPDKTGTFSGIRTNPSTGKKEMEFVMPKQFSPGEKEIKYIPYDEKTFQQVLNSLTPKKRDELRKLKGDFETQYAKMGEYVLDEDKLNTDVDEITKYYEENKADVGSDKFNNGFSELINKLGLDKNAKSNKTLWWFNPNELTIGDQTVQAGDKEKLKQVLYDLQKGKYKKQKGQSTSANPGLIPQGKVR